LAPVSTVIVAYQSGEFLRRCLAALGSGHGEVVVVDNASPDGVAELPRGGSYPEVRLIRLSRNDGFGSAANAGVAATSGDWVLLLNPDAWPLDDGVERLLEFAESRPGLGAAGPLLVDADGQPQRSTIRPPLGAAPLALWVALPGGVSRLYETWRRATGVVRRSSVRPGEFLQGAALLVRRGAFEQLGGFDESFFMYGEDADLCARLRDSGWSVELCDSARFVHVGGGSTGSDPERMRLELLRSWLRLIAKLKGMRQAERARRWVLFVMRARALASRDPSRRALALWLASGRAGELLGLPE
jgi:N-acetylglucosaminyl-diphospho-decaprenol L-rhamnosyltransferase